MSSSSLPDSYLQVSPSLYGSQDGRGMQGMLFSVHHFPPDEKIEMPSMSKRSSMAIFSVSFLSDSSSCRRSCPHLSGI